MIGVLVADTTKVATLLAKVFFFIGKADTVVSKVRKMFGVRTILLHEQWWELDCAVCDLSRARAQQGKPLRSSN